MKYLMIAALLISAPAMAFDFGDDYTNTQTQRQEQGQSQDQRAYGGDAKSIALAKSANALTINQESNAGVYSIRSTPDAMAPNV